MPFLDKLPLIGPWRVKNDEKKFKQWRAFLETQSSGSAIFQIVVIRQAYPNKGLKAYAQWLDGHTRAVWIPNAFPEVGMFVSAEGSCGHGEHHHEEVFYVNRLIAFIEKKYYAAMRRHVARANKSSKPNGVPVR